jgi:hypothetical protein
VHCIGEVWLLWAGEFVKWSAAQPWPLADAPIALRGLADGHLPADGFWARLPPGTRRVLGSWQVTSAGNGASDGIALANLVADGKIRATLPDPLSL